VKLPRRWRGYAYQVLYRLPAGVRRGLVRLVVPKYTVGAVTLVYDTEAAAPGRLLLLRQPPGRAWGLPAGLLKRHEEPIVGAARELHEESGVELAPDRLTPATPNAVVHLKGWVDMVYEARVPASATTLAVDGGEVLEAGWFPLDDLPRLTSPTAALLGVYGIGPRAGEAAPGQAATGRGAPGQGATGRGATGETAPGEAASGLP
jgi:ADP-ribose pyrophosphatase YjhB (NUDIX family)